MLKIFGAGLLVLCGALTGVALSSSLTQRVRVLEECMGMLRAVSEELRYTLAPMERVIGAVAARSGYSRLGFLRDCEALMARGMPFPHAWEKAVLDGAPHLDTEDARILACLGDVLGAGDISVQESAILNTTSMLAERLRMAREKRDSHARLYRALGFFGGLLTAIVIL